MQPSCVWSRSSEVPSVVSISLYLPFSQMFLAWLHFSQLPVNFRLLSFSTLYCWFLVFSLVFSSLCLTWWSPKGETLSFFCSFSSFFHAVAYVMSKWLLPFLFLWRSSNLHLRTYVQPACVSSRTSVVPTVAFTSLYPPFPHLFLALVHFSQLLVNFRLLSFSTFYCWYLVSFSVFSNLSLTWWSPKGEKLSFFRSFSSFFHAVAYVMSKWLLPFLFLWTFNNLHLRTYVQPSCV